MTGLIAIDESGDLGSHGTNYFAMAAIVMLRPRDLKEAANLLPSDKERKWHNSTKQVRTNLLKSLSKLRFKAVYTVVDKNHPSDHKYKYGNELYEAVLRTVISDSLSVLPCNDAVVIVDSSHFINIDKLRIIVAEEAIKYGVNVKRVDKIQSSQNKCIQIADFVAGASRSLYEHDDNSIDIIKNKVSVARRH